MRLLRPRLVLAAFGLTAALAAPAQASCPGADIVPVTAAQEQTAATATLCLVNERRAAAGRGPLRAGAVDITGIAEKWAATMAADNVVGHTGANGTGLSDRLAALKWKDHYAEGENVGLGFALLATPRGMVQSFMDSPSHRENILSSDYNEVGIGVRAGAKVVGVPLSAAYVMDFLGRDPVPSAAQAAAKRKAAAAKRRAAARKKARQAAARRAAARRRAS